MSYLPSPCSEARLRLLLCGDAEVGPSRAMSSLGNRFERRTFLDSVFERHVLWVPLASWSLASLRCALLVALLTFGYKESSPLLILSIVGSVSSGTRCIWFTVMLHEAPSACSVR